MNVGGLERARREPPRDLGRRRDVQVVEPGGRAPAAREDVLELGEDAQHRVDGGVAVERGEPVEVPGPQLDGARDVPTGGPWVPLPCATWFDDAPTRAPTTVTREVRKSLTARWS
jgi:hypothetical protein